MSRRLLRRILDFPPQRISYILCLCPTGALVVSLSEAADGGEMIRKVKAGYKVVSTKGKNLGGPIRPSKRQKNASARLNSSNTEKIRPLFVIRQKRFGKSQSNGNGKVRVALDLYPMNKATS